MTGVEERDQVILPDPRGAVSVLVERLGGPAELADEIVSRLPASASGEGLLTALVEVLAEKNEALRLHQVELEQTNSGLLALHAQLETRQRQMALLDEINRSLSSFLDTGHLVARLTDLLREHDVADEVAIWLPDATTGALTQVGTKTTAPDRAVRHAYERGRDHHDGGHALMAMRVGTQPIGVMRLSRRAREFDDAERDLAGHIATRAATALRNAYEYERERDLAQTLQQEMLPELAQVPGIDLAAVYRPASQGRNVGGDWYDSFRTPRGTLILTVGDVTGHGLDAAVLMGRLRNVVRAYTMEGHGPAAALALVHELLRQEHTKLFATAVLAELDPATGVLRWANAGHMPPMVRDAAGGVTRLEPSERGLMLGVPMAARIPEHTTNLDAEATLLLYTDGLIERRQWHLDTGLAMLEDRWQDLPNGATDAIAAQLLTLALDATENPDDVCLLLCRRAPEGSLRDAVRETGAQAHRDHWER